MPKKLVINPPTKEQILEKLNKRLKAAKLMRKHGFTTAYRYSSDVELHTLENTIKFIERGGSYRITNKGFLSTRLSVVAI